jgi:peptide/nickel transport system substrate-binding protein
MDYPKLDKVRRTAIPQQLDLVEHFMAGTITRRQFISRAVVAGLSMGSISAVIAACSSTSSSPSASAGGAASAAAPSAAGSAAASAAASGAAGGTIRVAAQRPKVALDPVAMVDLSAYDLTSQSFEFLCALSKDASDIAPGLAEKWTPNADNSVWTFNLRKGVTWHDGTPFTADDVVATMERLVTAGNSGLKGVIQAGSAVATDTNTVTFTLVSANGNFPYLVSVFNAQSLITPKAYAAGTTLDKVPAGTGAFKLTSYDNASGAKYVKNDKWWGGAVPLDGVEFIFFDQTGAMVTAYQGQQVDALVQFDVLSGASLFNDPNFLVVETPTTNHREIWMRCDTGQFKDKRVRQALALTIDRPALIQQLFKGKAVLANDHVIAPFYPYFSDTVTQRTQDIQQAKELLAAAGVANLNATLSYGQLNEIPDLAVLLASQAAPAGITIKPDGMDNNAFYDAKWCPPNGNPPCSGAVELGIVDYGHRPTPDVFLNSAFKSKGVWNSSQYSSADFDAAFTEFQKAVGVDAQKAACAKIEKIMNDDVPAAIPYFYNYLSGNAKTYQGIYTSALGQMVLSSASKV